MFVINLCFFIWPQPMSIRSEEWQHDGRTWTHTIQKFELILIGATEQNKSSHLSKFNIYMENSLLFEYMQLNCLLALFRTSSKIFHNTCQLHIFNWSIIEQCLNIASITLHINMTHWNQYRHTNSDDHIPILNCYLIFADDQV